VSPFSGFITAISVLTLKQRFYLSIQAGTRLVKMLSIARQNTPALQAKVWNDVI